MARVSFMLRWRGPDASAVTKGRLMSLDWVVDSSHLALSAPSLSLCSAMGSRERSMPSDLRNSSTSQSMIF